MAILKLYLQEIYQKKNRLNCYLLKFGKGEEL